MHALHTTFYQLTTPQLQKITAVFIATLITTLIFYRIDQMPWAMIANLGIIAAALSDHHNSYRGRFVSMVIMMIFFSASSLSTHFFLQKSMIFIPLISVFTFVLVMLSALGERYSKIAFSTLLISVYTALMYRSQSPWYEDTLIMLIGAIIYSLISLVLFMLSPSRESECALKDFIKAVGHYALKHADDFEPHNKQLFSTAKASKASQQRVIESWNHARETLFNHLRHAHRNTKIQKMIAIFFTVQELWEYVSSEHDPFTYSDPLAHADILFRIRLFIEHLGQECLNYANHLEGNPPYSYNHHLDQEIEALEKSLKYHADIVDDSAIVM